MKKVLSVLVAVAFATGLITTAAAQQSSQQGATGQSQQQRTPGGAQGQEAGVTDLESEIIVFADQDFQGEHTHFVSSMQNIGNWDNSISSLIIKQGTWQFFDDQNFQGNMMKELGPGMYPRVQDIGINDNSISSIRLVSPTAQRQQQMTAGGAREQGAGAGAAGPEIAALVLSERNLMGTVTRVDQNDMVTVKTDAGTLQVRLPGASQNLKEGDQINLEVGYTKVRGLEGTQQPGTQR